ncbi:LysE family transporter [Runella sp.]|jgi:threonine/homoserine/homoserine lactone efflux protein|uniref:LysE family translocator n=1 Tax=Runella sp. TaxID=1960881 RepID=UPI00262D0A72|nr:LysE family transporter [Runella sp.]
MDKSLVIFFATAAISFVGSLQLGPVNLIVIQSVLKRNLQAGLWIALGGCLPELIYSAAAVGAGMWLEKNPGIRNVLEWSAVPLLLGIGIVIFVTPNRPTNLEKEPQQSFSFLKGLTLGLLNPQLFPYWLIMLVQFGMYNALRVQSRLEQIAFILGTAVGALGLLMGAAYLTSHFRESLLVRLGTFNFNRFLGALFVLLAVGQLLKLYL